MIIIYLLIVILIERNFAEDLIAGHSTADVDSGRGRSSLSSNLSDKSTLSNVPSQSSTPLAQVISCDETCQLLCVTIDYYVLLIVVVYNCLLLEISVYYCFL